MGKRILFCFSAGVGPLIRALPIMKRFKEDGYIVGYEAIDNVSDYLDPLGFIKIEAVEESDYEFVGKIDRKWYDADNFWYMLGYKNVTWLKKLWAKYFIAVESFKPDIIVGDFNIDAKAASMFLRIPYVSITQGCYHPEVKGDRLRWWENKPENTPTVYNEINGVLDTFGIKTKITRLEDMFVGDKTIIPSIPEFDSLKVISPNDCFVGPILWDSKEIQAKINIRKSDLFNISVYTGRLIDSAGNSGEAILKHIISVAKELPYRFNVVTGGLESFDEYRDMISQIPNISIYKWLQIEDIYNSDLVIHHGGHGSCMATFKYGVPSFVMPTHSEREYNAVAIKNLGVGDYIDPFAISDVHAICQHIENLLQDISFKNECLKWKEIISEKYPDSIDSAYSVIKDLCK